MIATQLSFEEAADTYRQVCVQENHKQEEVRYDKSAWDEVWKEWVLGNENGPVARVYEADGSLWVRGIPD